MATLNPFSLEALKQQSKKASTGLLTSSTISSTPSQSSYSPYSSNTLPTNYKLPATPSIAAPAPRNGIVSSSFDSVASPSITSTPLPSFNTQATSPQVTGGFNLSSPTTAPKIATSAPVSPAMPAPIAPTAPVSPVQESSSFSSSSVPQSSLSSPGGGSPTVPSVDPSIQSAYDSASKSYEESLKLSPEELSTQQDVDNLITSTKKAYADIEDKAIPMQFITGQLSSVERRAGVLAEPLERKLARLQATRTANLEASKYSLDRADKKLTESKSAIAQAAKDAEDKRRFELNYGLSKDKATQDKLESDRVFNEDVRQFGLNYALQQKSLAQTASNKTAAEKQVETEKTQAALGTVNLVNQLLEGDYEGITGGIFGRSILTRLGTTNQKEDNLFKSIQAQLALGARQLVKGTGAISDFEAKTLQQASSTLGTNMKNEDFKNSLIQIKGALMSNAGLEVQVKITDPKTGKSQSGNTTREGVGTAIADGLIVEYQ